MEGTAGTAGAFSAVFLAVLDDKGMIFVVETGVGGKVGHEEGVLVHATHGREHRLDRLKRKSGL